MNRRNEKYARTRSGDFWEIGEDGNYHKPGIDNLIAADSDSIIDRSNEIYELIVPGDLIILKGETGKIVQDKDLVSFTKGQKRPCVSRLLKIKAIFTAKPEHTAYVRQVYDHNGLWIID